MSELEGIKSFLYPKFFNNRKYEELIPWLGSALLVSASSGEASHKEVKDGYRHSNKQGESATDQVPVWTCKWANFCKLQITNPLQTA